LAGEIRSRLRSGGCPGIARVRAKPEATKQLHALNTRLLAADGHETCRRLRRLPGLDKAVIAAVSD
jgi:hypothetical protein